MTRTGATKAATSADAYGRLAKARAFHEVAVLTLAQWDRLRDPAPIAANAILAATAYADAVSAAYGGRINQKDHAAAPKLLRAVLGKNLPDHQENRLARLLGRKDEMQYGARLVRSQDAQQVVAQLEAFAAWAQEMLAALAIATPGGTPGDGTAGLEPPST